MAQLSNKDTSLRKSSSFAFKGTQKQRIFAHTQKGTSYNK